MAGSVNKVILVGNLGRDPEVRSMQDGRSMVNMSVATSDTWRDRQSGERKERTEWHRVVIFNEKLAEVAQKYVRKGSKVYVEGQLSTRKWTDQSGQERYTTEVVIPRFGGWLVAAWLFGIIVNLLTYPGFYDIALRDFGLLVAAVALARLATVYAPGRGAVRTQA